MATVTAPVADFAGEVVGVRFDKGRASTDDRRALDYFRRHGYMIDDETPDPTPEPPDPRDIGTDGDGIEVVGTPLRDAAVDPRPEDFLPPTNAGQANPHGPEVVSPGLHGVEGVRPVRPGPVPEKSTAAQEVAETAHTEAEHAEAVTVPAKSASKAEWAAYATSLGATDAESRTKAELVELYGTEATSGETA